MGAVFQASDNCVTVNPSPDPTAPCSLNAVPYAYVPTLWVSIVFTVLFGLLFVTHVFLAIFRWRRGNFMLLAATCAAGELAGWASRLRSSYYPFDVNAYIAQMVSLILSPAFLSAANYFLLEKIIAGVGTELSRLPARLYLALFVTGDIVSLILQAIGGGGAASANTQAQLDLGTNIMIAGVSVQVGVTVPFLILFVDFHVRHLLRYRKQVAEGGKEAALDSPWDRKLLTLSAASFFSTLMIVTRCIYRVVEMAQGWRGHLATTEVYFGILDGLVILLATAIFVFFHPGFLLPQQTERQRAAAEQEQSEKAAESPEATDVEPEAQMPGSPQSSAREA